MKDAREDRPQHLGTLVDDRPQHHGTLVGDRPQHHGTLVDDRPQHTKRMSTIVRSATVR